MPTTMNTTTASPLLRPNHSQRVETMPCLSSRNGSVVQLTPSSTLAVKLSSPCAAATRAGVDIPRTGEAIVGHGPGSRRARSVSTRMPPTQRTRRRRRHPLKAPPPREKRVAALLSTPATRSQPRTFQYTLHDPYSQHLSQARKLSTMTFTLLLN